METIVYDFTLTSLAHDVQTAKVDLVEAIRVVARAEKTLTDAQKALHEARACFSNARTALVHAAGGDDEGLPPLWSHFG